MGLCFCISGYYQCLFSGCLGWCSSPWLGTPAVVCLSCISFSLCFSQYVHHWLLHRLWLLRILLCGSFSDQSFLLRDGGYLGGYQGPLGEFWRCGEVFRRLPSFFKEVS